MYINLNKKLDKYKDEIQKLWSNIGYDYITINDYEIIISNNDIYSNTEKNIIRINDLCNYCMYKEFENKSLLPLPLTKDTFLALMETISYIKNI